MHEELFKALSNGQEFSLKFKGAKTPLTLLETDNGFVLHGFFNNDEEDIKSLAESEVLDKDKGEIVHFNEDEDYVSINFEKKELLKVLDDSKYYMC